MVGLVWFGLVNEDVFKRPQVPLKVAKAKLELHLGTIPAWVGPVRSNSDYKAISVQLQLQLPTGTELGNYNFVYSFRFVELSKAAESLLGKGLKFCPIPKGINTAFLEGIILFSIFSWICYYIINHLLYFSDESKQRP